MAVPDRLEGALGLADFLSDLRAELAEAARRAHGESLILEVGEVTVSLDVGVTLTNTTEGSGKASAKFWVFASTEGHVRGERSSERAATQHLTLTLTPRVTEVVHYADGGEAVLERSVTVSGAFDEGEEQPER